MALEAFLVVFGIHIARLAGGASLLSLPCADFSA
jgi:hypothetical protein